MIIIHGKVFTVKIWLRFHNVRPEDNSSDDPCGSMHNSLLSQACFRLWEQWSQTMSRTTARLPALFPVFSAFVLLVEGLCTDVQGKKVYCRMQPLFLQAADLFGRRYCPADRIPFRQNWHPEASASYAGLPELLQKTSWGSGPGSIPGLSSWHRWLRRIRWQYCFIWLFYQSLLRKRNSGHFLFRCNGSLRTVTFRNPVIFCTQSSDMIIELTWLDSMIQTPMFISHTTRTTLLDDVEPFFIGSSWMSFQSKLPCRAMLGTTMNETL